MDKEPGETSGTDFEKDFELLCRYGLHPSPYRESYHRIQFSTFQVAEALRQAEKAGGGT